MTVTWFLFIFCNFRKKVDLKWNEKMYCSQTSKTILSRIEKEEYFVYNFKRDQWHSRERRRYARDFETRGGSSLKTNSIG